MRLLHTRKPGLEFEEFQGENIPSYAILSHTWYSDDQEVSYQDVCDGIGQDRRGYRKILECKALASDYDFFWVDTCCIDKTSSVELAESINSMYSWYEKAAACYVYLADVPFHDTIETLKRSRWFTRGWTLQELIAPTTVVFFSREWERISEKCELLDAISDITGIPHEALSGQARPAKFSIAERMSWASNRATTRVEDEAYSLMGLFGVHMPLLYGEKEKAFRRLQEEIMKTTDDQSLFAWADPELGEYRLTGLLAQRPRSFAKSKNVHSMGLWGKGNVLGTTNRGIRVKLYLTPIGNGNSRDFAACLDCWMDSQREDTVAIFLRRLGTDGTGWDTTHETQFARMHIVNSLGVGTKRNKIGGAYREICVNDLSLEPVQLGLGAYDSFGKHVLIRHPCRPFTVHPVDCWEPQSAVFTAAHNYAGPLGAVCFPIDDRVYDVFFGRDEKGEFWVSIDFRTSTADSVDDGIWMFQQLSGTKNSRAELSYKSSEGPNSWGKIVGEVKVTALYHVLIYELSIDINRATPGEQDGEDEKEPNLEE